MSGIGRFTARGIALVAFALCACRATDVCGSRQEDVREPDGGALFRCVVPEDCPRPSNVSVCLTNTTPEKRCVTCLDTHCVETLPLPCDTQGSARAGDGGAEQGGAF